MGVLLVAAFGGQMLRLAFNPPTTKPITFHVAVLSTRILPYEPGGAKTNLTKFGSEYDAVLRFANRKSHRFALHGRIQNAKVTMHEWTKEEENELVRKLNRSVVTASFDRQGKTIEPIIAFEPNHRDGSFELTSYLDELAGRTFMNFDYPQSKISEGSNLVTKLEGRQFYPNREMVRTNLGQTVLVEYHVTSIKNSGKRTLVSFHSLINTTISQNNPAEDNHLVKIKEEGEFTIDATDGLLVSGRLNRTESEAVTEFQSSVSIVRR